MGAGASIGTSSAHFFLRLRFASRTAPHYRFFVAELFSPDGLDPIPRLERDTTVMWKCAVTADRRSFTGFCEKQ